MRSMIAEMLCRLCGYPIKMTNLFTASMYHVGTMIVFDNVYYSACNRDATGHGAVINKPSFFDLPQFSGVP